MAPCRGCNNWDSAPPAGGLNETLHQACAQAKGGIVSFLAAQEPAPGAISSPEQVQQTEQALLDHLVGAQQNRRRQIEAERPGRFQIDD